MKDIWESPEAFSAYATIEAGYYMMQEAQAELDKFVKNRSPVEKAIDETTGYFKDKMEKHTAFMQMCILDIIEAKKIIEADYEGDNKILLHLQKLKSNIVSA